MGENVVYDAIIVGAGVAGCVTALSVLKSNPRARLLVIDDSDDASFKVGESLPAEAKRLLEYLSPTLLEQLSRDKENDIHTSCTGNASVWESPDLRETYSIMNPFGSGWHLNRAAFDACLRARLLDVCTTSDSGSKLVKAKFVSTLKGSKVATVVTEDLASNSRMEYRAAWLIDATGRRASVAKQLGAKTVKADALLAFYTLFETIDPDLDHRTLIEATQTGWWYSSQLSQHKRIVVFHADDRDPSSKIARKLDGFLDTLHNDTSHISQIIDQTDYHVVKDAGANYPRCTAAGSSYLEPFGSQVDRWCAIGDAALAFDPLSSQGMITAMRLGCSLGAVLSKQIESTDQSSSDTVDLESIRDLYTTTWEEYRQKHKYYYDKSMFDDVFWERRRV